MTADLQRRLCERREFDRIIDDRMIFGGEEVVWVGRMALAGEVKRDKYYNIFSNDFAAHDFAIPFSSIILSSMILSEKIEG